MKRPTEPAGPSPARVYSAELMGREGELVILHRGETYRLWVTRKGKLILSEPSPAADPRPT